MEVTQHVHVRVDDASAAGQARREAMLLATHAGLDETVGARVGLVVTEASTNLLKHAGGGEVLLSSVRGDGGRAVAVLALDRGPGIGNLSQALRDGFSSAGSSGTGLGAIRRLATVFDVYSAPGAGTAVLATVGVGSPWPADLHVGGVNVPVAGEEVSGDGWVVSSTGGRTVVLVADGLGHGVMAAEAARAAEAAFRRHVAARPAEVLARIHDALRATRGAAVAVAELDRARGVVRFAGIGNISGSIVDEGATRSLVSHYGTAGHAAHHIQEFAYPWHPGALLVLHSDGLVTHWSFAKHPGLAARHPMVIAGVLYRDFRRGRDDTSVVVLREAE